MEVSMLESPPDGEVYSVRLLAFRQVEQEGFPILVQRGQLSFQKVAAREE